MSEVVSQKVPRAKPAARKKPQVPIAPTAVPTVADLTVPPVADPAIPPAAPVVPNVTPAESESPDVAGKVQSALSENGEKAQNDSSENGEKVTSATDKVTGSADNAKCAISAARVRNHMNRAGINETIGKMIDETKEKLEPLKAAADALNTKTVTEKSTDAAPVTRDLTPAELADHQQTLDSAKVPLADLEQTLKALSSEKTRFSSDAPQKLAHIIDETISQLADTGIANAIASEDGSLRVKHILSNASSVALLSLVKTLPSWESAQKAFDDAERDNDLNAKLKEAEKNFKHIWKVKRGTEPRELPSKPAGTLPSIKETPAPDTENTAEQTPLANKTSSDDGELGFKFCVANICRKQATLAGVPKLRVFGETKTFLANLVAELIARLNPILYILMTSSKNKTVSEDMVLTAVKILLSDNRAIVDDVKFTQVTEPDQTAVKADAVNAKKAAAENQEHVPAEIPEVTRTIAVRNLHHPDSGFAELEKILAEKFGK